MIIFYLVRHGQIKRGQASGQINHADPPLSAQGRVDAEEVARYLRPRPITRIYASPLRRAQETAAIIATFFDLPVRVEPLLRERMNFGDLPEQSFAEFAELWARSSRERDYLPPLGDSSRAAGERVEAFMAAVQATLPAGEVVAEVVAVAHGGLIADFLLNIAPITELAEISPAFVAQPYAGEVMRNGSITVVKYTEMGNGLGTYRVKAIALTTHLHPI